MKIKLIGGILRLGIAFGLLGPRLAWAQADGEQFYNRNDMGCIFYPGSAGEAGSGTANTGGSQARCIGCEGGMPRWWVDEPYINLHLADEPLSYLTSSGQKMSFRFLYKQRYENPHYSECPDFYYIGGLSGFGRHISAATGAHVLTDMRSYNMTNAAWSHNWMMNIMFWCPDWEKVSFSPPAYLGRPDFSAGYEALVFHPEGGIDYFLKTDGVVNLTDPQSQRGLRPLSGSNPQVPLFPNPDDNEIYWGDDGYGFQLVYPDGSKDVFSLTFFLYATSHNSQHTDSQAEALLTQRIDPQGRVTQIGYEDFSPFTNTLNPNDTYGTFRVKYVVDPDGRTNTFRYVSTGALHAWQVSEIDDPYGRKATFTYDGNGRLHSIVDAATNTSTFAYQGGNGWITSLATPYGTNNFSFYQATESGTTDKFLQRATYVSEPLGAGQLFYYVHQAPGGVPDSVAVPTVPGRDFDSGANGVSSAPQLSYRDSFHWDRRQFAALSTNVTAHLSTLQTALGNLTAADFTKAHLSHWMFAADGVTLSDTITAERDPSTDMAGQNPGGWTFYAHHTSNPDIMDSSPFVDSAQIFAVARVLPDNSSQFVRYNYYNASTVVAGNSETSITLPDGSPGERTNWFIHNAFDTTDLLSLSNSLGQYVNFGYANHQVTNITDALNQVTSLTYDSTSQNLTHISYPSGQTVTLTYYAGSSPPTSTSSLLEQIEVEPEGRFVNIIDYTNGLPHIVHVSGTGLVDLYLTNYWDGLNRLTGVAFTDGTTISNVYTFLDLTAQKDRLGHWTYFVYDALEHLSYVSNALQNVTHFGWCGCGALSTITDATLTNTTTLIYDNQGKLTDILFPDTSSLSYHYDLAGRMTSASDGSTRSATFGYNLQGLLNSVSTVNGQVLQVAYDLVDRPHVVTDANNLSVTYGYDALNRLKNRTVGSSPTESFDYATNGLITYTNADQKVTHFGRDNAGRLITVTNANLETNLLIYDAADRITSLVDGLAHTTTWQYNQYGWLTGKLDNLSHLVLSNGFDADGELTARWTPAGGNTGYHYDAVGNLTNVDYSGAAIPTASISLAYDRLNQLTNLIDAVGTTGFSYTETGQLKNEDGPWAGDTVGYGYTEGHRTSLSLNSSPTAFNLTYAYDSIWRLQTLTSPAGAFGYGYFASTPASALVQSITLPNYAAITNHYDSLERLDVTDLVNYWGHTLDGASYGYDALGLRTNLTRNLGLTTNLVSVGYDNIGQIKSWSGRETNGTLRLNEQLGYGYDAADNLHLRTNNALVQTFTVDALNELSNVTRTGTFTVSGATPAPATNVTVNGSSAQLYSDLTFAGTSINLSNGSNTFTIIASNIYNLKATNTFTVNLPTNVSFQSDANGNLTNDGTRSFVYDAENQLTNVNVPGQWKTEFVYDGFGRRRKSFDYTWSGTNWAKTNETRFVYDGMLIIQERDSNNAAQVIYTRGLDLSGGLQGAGGIGGLLARTDATNGSTFYHADGAGNITSLMDASQNIVARYLYDPFGRLTGKWGTNADANVMRFSSMPTHRQSGLSLYAFRAYDPSLQRWLNRDPIGEAGGINLFRITHNNPANQIDPLGFDDDPLAAQMMQNEMMDYYMGDGWSALDQQRRRQMFDMVSDAADFIGVGQVVRGMEESDQSLLLGAKDVAVGTANFGMLFWPLGKGKALATASEKCIVGKAGSYAALKKLAKVGDKLVAHHMPQAALKFTGRAEGGAIVITEAEHFLTRTFGSRGAKLAIEEAAENFGDVLAKDISDLREIVGSKYDEGIKELSKYYMEHFPELFSK